MSLAPALRVLTAAVLACLLTASTALAADGEGTPLDLEGKAEGGQAVSQGASGGDLVRTIVGLAIVLAVIFGLHWVLKQVRAAKEDDASGAGLESLATLPLGANRSLHLVRAGAEVVLVGTGEGGVTAIRTYHEAEARALGLIEDELGGRRGAGDAPTARFGDLGNRRPAAELVGLPAPDRGEASWGAAKPLPAARRLMDTLRAKTVR